MTNEIRTWHSAKGSEQIALGPLVLRIQVDRLNENNLRNAAIDLGPYGSTSHDLPASLDEAKAELVRRGHAKILQYLADYKVGAAALGIALD